MSKKVIASVGYNEFILEINEQVYGVDYRTVSAIEFAQTWDSEAEARAAFELAGLDETEWGTQDFPDAIVESIISGNGGRNMQRQDSLTDQLASLVVLANREGLYDAADFIRDFIKRASEGGQDAQSM